ncbi:MAG: hypothetical protein LUG16_02595 [Candidatus Gastranaerophilales bacterium]|nr:hypothetical protein [Candidatus Gastranaerophilales bacterium]
MSISSVGMGSPVCYSTTAFAPVPKTESEKRKIDEETNASIEKRGLETEEKLQRYEQLHNEGLMTDSEYKCARVKAQAAQMAYASVLTAMANIEKNSSDSGDCTVMY